MVVTKYGLLSLPLIIINNINIITANIIITFRQIGGSIYLMATLIYIIILSKIVLSSGSENNKIK